MAAIGMPWSQSAPRMGGTPYGTQYAQSNEFNNANQYLHNVPGYHSYFFGRFLIHQSGPKAAIWAGRILQIALAFFCISLPLLIFVFASDFEDLFGSSAEGRSTEATPVNATVNGTTTTTQNSIPIEGVNKYDISESTSKQFFTWTRLLTPPICGVSGFLCIVCGIILYCYSDYVVRGVERLPRSGMIRGLDGSMRQLETDNRPNEQVVMRQINAIDTAGEGRVISGYDYHGPDASGYTPCPEIAAAQQQQTTYQSQPPQQEPRQIFGGTNNLEFQPQPTNQQLPETYSYQSPPSEVNNGPSPANSGYQPPPRYFTAQ